MSGIQINWQNFMVITRKESKVLISLFKPDYIGREQGAVQRVLASGWTGLGPETEKFEEEFSQYIGSPYSVGTNSCTSALTITLKALGIGPGDEVIVPALTFVSTAHAVTYCGATPILCDIDKKNLTINWEDAARRITSKTKAIIAVIYSGEVPKITPSTFHGLPVVWDCAHAVGTNVSFSHPSYCCYSFAAVKNLSCGDGGMITSDDEEFTERCEALRWMGIDKSTWSRIETGSSSPDVFSQKYSWEYTCDEIGFKGHMNDIAAAIGRVQLKRLGLMQVIRRALAVRYLERLQEPRHKGLISLPNIMSGHGLHLFVIRTDRRNELASYLKERGIQTGVHYRPVHLHKCYHGDQPKIKSRTLKVVEKEWTRLLSLPLHTHLSNDDIDKITDTIKDFFK